MSGFHVSRSTGNARCSSCGKPAPKPKKGLCAGCYLRAWRGDTLGSECQICHLRDQRVLRRVKLAASTSTLCANHAAIAGRRAITLTALRAECFPAGDRRQADRRTGDRRAPLERRRRVDVNKLLEEERRGKARR